MRQKKIFVPFLLAIAAAALLMGFFYYQGYCESCFSLRSLTPSVIKKYIEQTGPWAFVVYVGLYTINTISLIPPIGVMSLSAGFLFGPLWGSLAIMCGSFLGTSATFAISRIFGSRVVQRLSRGRMGDFQQRLNERGFAVILFIRLIPLLPWEVVNYASGLSRIRYRDYMAGTLLGIIPAVVVQTFFSDRLAKFDLRDPALLIAIVAFVLLGAVPVIYLKWRGRSSGPISIEKQGSTGGSDDEKI